MSQAETAPQTTPVATYTFDEVAAHYNFPDNQGEGVTIGILSWSKTVGGIGVCIDSIKQGLKKAKLPIPTYHFDYFGGQKNSGADSGELHMDTAIVSHFCPQATIHIYIATPATAHLAIQQAVSDGCSVTTCSFGIHDASLVDDIAMALDNAALNRVTTCFAAGDSGAASGQSSVDAVVFPAAHPTALAVGGTYIPTGQPPQGTSCGPTTLSVEQVWWNYPDPNGHAGRPWWASGGGVSKLYAVPTYQSSLNPTSFPVNGQSYTGRGVPDVAAFAQGLETCVGTSASTPTWASLIARINSQLGNAIGNIHNLIYHLPVDSGVFESITLGCNIPPQGQPGSGNGYTAQPGWDLCTGWGIPDGMKLLAALQVGT